MISLAMIAKNEEGRIRRTLLSVQGSVGEMVVVDTGSEDATPDIAKSLGAKVIVHPFGGDFSEVRNVSIEACRGEWILVMDADEFFPLSPRLMLETATQAGNSSEDPGYKGFYLLRHNYEKNAGEVAYSDYVLRLFRNDPRVRYRHRVHETLEESLDGLAGRYGQLTAMPLSHHIFERGAAFQEAKHEKYIEWLLKDIEKNPGDAGRYDFLGCEYVRIGQWDLAESAFRKWLKLDPDSVSARESLEMVMKMKSEGTG